MVCSLLDLLQMQKHHFRPSLVIHGNRSFQELHYPVNLSITQRQFHLKTHCLFLRLSICLHSLIYTLAYAGDKIMTTKLRPSYADSVTATSWSPWPKAWVGNHYCPARGFCECVCLGNINPARWVVVVSHPRFWPRGPACGGH